MFWETRLFHAKTHHSIGLKARAATWILPLSLNRSFLDKEVLLCFGKICYGKNKIKGGPVSGKQPCADLWEEEAAGGWLMAEMRILWVCGRFLFSLASTKPKCSSHVALLLFRLISQQEQIMMITSQSAQGVLRTQPLLYSEIRSQIAVS